MDLDERLDILEATVKGLREIMQAQTAELAAHTLHDDRQWHILREQMREMHLENQEAANEALALSKDTNQRTAEQTLMLEALVSAKRFSILSAQVIKHIGKFVGVVGGAIVAAYTAWKMFKGQP